MTMPSDNPTTLPPTLLALTFEDAWMMDSVKTGFMLPFVGSGVFVNAGGRSGSGMGMSGVHAREKEYK